MSSNIFLLNANIRHQIFLLRFAGHEVKTLNKAIDKTRTATLQVLLGTSINDLPPERLKKVLRDIKVTNSGIHKTAATALMDSMKDFADYEVGFGKRMLEDAVKMEIATPRRHQVHNALFKTPVTIGVDSDKTVEQLIGEFGRRKTVQINRLIREGIVSGSTNVEIRNAVREITTGQQKSAASAIVRTLTNHVANESRTELYKANSDVIKEIKYVATLDGRTTSTCAALDGKRFPINVGPRPPQHWGCRSTTTPVVKEEFNILPGLKTKRSARNTLTGKSELVSGNTTYNSWMKDQPKSFQEDVLGRSRTKLFREGKLPMDKFVDKRFQPLTLEELGKKEPLAFERAGLD